MDVLTPLERKELVRLVLHRAEVADRPRCFGDLPRYAPRTGDATGPFTLCGIKLAPRAGVWAPTLHPRHRASDTESVSRPCLSSTKQSVARSFGGRPLMAGLVFVGAAQHSASGEEE